jgi:hypothetical protein
MTQLPAQIAGMNVQGAVMSRENAVENFLSQLLSRNDAACRAKQHFQEVELGGCQFQRFPAAEDRAGPNIQLYVTEHYSFLPGLIVCRSLP